MHSKALTGLCGFAAALLFLGIGSVSRAQDERPSYDGFRDGVFLRYLNARGAGIAAPPRIGLSFGSRTIRAVLDSGSTGVVVAAALIPDFDSLPSLGEGKLTYTSSGRIMLGRWVTTPLALVGQDGARLETEPMPVLAVTRVRCLQHARSCTPNDAPRSIAMVGVGFGREGDRQSRGTPDKNPLLRAMASGAERRRGYVLGAEGVHVGLTEANTRGDFTFVKLMRQPDRPDWSAVPACFSLNGQAPPACGNMLVDTGVAAMFMTAPPAQTGAMTGTLATGTEVSIRLGTAEQSSELYRFTVGGQSPLAPDRIHLRVSRDRVFVNTSFRLLNGFDMLYDADGGYAGFRKR